MGLWRLRGRSAVTLASVIALTATGTLAVSSALAPEPINGCVSKLTGNVRVIASGQSCSALENPLSWNTSGPAGPQGPQGVPGPKGAQGERGPAGTVDSYFDKLPQRIDLSDAPPARPKEISGWDLPAGSYRLEGQGMIRAYAEPTEPGTVRCSLRAGDQILKEVDTRPPAGVDEAPMRLVTIVKVVAPSRLSLTCFTVDIGIRGAAAVFGSTFEVTRAGQTRGI